MERFRKRYVQAVVVVTVMLLSACGATRVELPLDLASEIKASGYQMPQYQADLLVVMNEDDAGLRYMAAVHDIKLQLEVGSAYKQNLLGVMDMMFASIKHVASVKDVRKSADSTEVYMLEAAFQLVHVTIPRTRFGKTQAHIVTRYTLFDANGKKLFSYTDYALGSKVNSILMAPGMSMFVGEGGLTRDAMKHNMVNSITQLADTIQQYMNVKTRDTVLKELAQQEKALADAAHAYAGRITSADYQVKKQAAMDLRHDPVHLAVVQGVMEKELLKMADRELKDGASAAAAKEMCAALAMTGMKKYLQTFQHIASNGKDLRLRKWGKSYHAQLLSSLCGAGNCSQEEKQAAEGT